jgi:pyridoxine 5-phosphate synthase
MIQLGVNIDHVATVRQARRGVEPDPVRAAHEAELGGADGITVHLREDRRHIQDHDVERLRASVNVKLNLEMAATDEMVAIAARVRSPTPPCSFPRGARRSRPRAGSTSRRRRPG